METTLQSRPQEPVLSIWDQGYVADELENILKETTDFELVLAQIPGLFGNSRKATYLGFRAVGLTAEQAMSCMNSGLEELQQWYAELPEMKEFELRCLHDLQRRISADIVRLGFLRNMTMFLFRDHLTIQKSFRMDEMDSREFNYLRGIRRFYGAHDLLALEKAIAPEKHRNNTLILSFGQQAYEIVDEPNSIRLIESPEEVEETSDE